MPRDPRQPSLIDAPSRSILDVVKEGLVGLEYRQRERDARRRETNEKCRKWKLQRSKRAATQKPMDLREEESKMRVLKVTYRAIMSQPIHILNPGGMKMGGDVPVEVFHKSERWFVRSLLTGNTFERLAGRASSKEMMDSVDANFEITRESWQMWGTPPLTPTEKLAFGAAKKAELRMIEPGEVKVLADGRVGWMELEDFTHIIHAPTMDPKQKIPTAACGNQVDAAAFINNKANLKPTCQGCAEVWEREYKGK